MEILNKHHLSHKMMNPKQEIDFQELNKTTNYKNFIAKRLLQQPEKQHYLNSTTRKPEEQQHDTHLDNFKEPSRMSKMSYHMSDDLKTKSKQHTSNKPRGRRRTEIVGFNLSRNEFNTKTLSATNRKLLVALLAITIFTIKHNPVTALSLEGPIEGECTTNDECRSSDKICHDNKCICEKDRPIEDRDRCLAHAILNEQCFISEQCLGNSICLGGICSCGDDAVSFLNPSIKLYYCHPKRKLNEQCNYDQQCPPFAFCSTDEKYGCLCQDGYGPSTVSNGGIETVECLPKICTESSTCESEFHHCEDNKCKCLATHYDPTSAKCYKFGSKAGKLTDGSDTDDKNKTITSNNTDDGFTSIAKDLSHYSESKLWFVIVFCILFMSTIFLIILVLRKYCLGSCWSANKKEYEPNNENSSKKGNFNKNSINNKSFRKKNSDLEGECDYNDDDETAVLASKAGGFMDRNAFVAPSQKESNSHVKVDVNANSSKNNNNNKRKTANNEHSSNDYQPNNQPFMLISPLASSTSTPV